MSSNVGIAFAMVIAAGMCTGVGASLVLFGNIVSIANRSFLAGALGISAGVMLYVTFVEIFQKSLGGFHEAGVSGDTTSGLVYVSATLCFFGGIVLMILLDKFVHWLGGGNIGHEDSAGVLSTPSPQTYLSDPERAPLEQEMSKQLPKHLSHLTDGCSAHIHAHGQKDSQECCDDTNRSSDDNKSTDNNKCDIEAPAVANKVITSSDDVVVAPVQDQKLTRMGLMTALAIGLHNFPEGIATFVATLDDPNVGAALAVAIGIHNIPEGLCVSIPIYYATGSRAKALGWAFLSGISEPIGALLAYLVLMNHIGPMAYGIVFGFVGGMMCYICLHELIPTAHRYDPEDKVTTLSVVLGMVIMATSLVLFVLEPNPVSIVAACNNSNITV
jgi:ZIP family zinc transporter